MQPAVLDQPIAGRQAWTRATLRESDYRVVLSDAAQRELLDAAATLRRQPVPLLALRPDSLDLPACRAAMEEVRAILTRGVRFALLDRLPIEALAPEEAKALYWILSSMLARPVAQKLDGTIVYDVHDTGQKALPGSGIRPDKTNIDLQFHNDNAYNFLMPEFVGLLCLRQAKEGGLSRVMSFATAHNALLSTTSFGGAARRRSGRSLCLSRAATRNASSSSRRYCAIVSKAPPSWSWPCSFCSEMICAGDAAASAKICRSSAGRRTAASASRSRPIAGSTIASRT